ncbi:MAG: AI-2E family transporter [Sarcina sp.]
MFKNKKFYFNLIPIILITIILIKLVFNIETVFSKTVGTLLTILVPFIWALVIAYLINPLMLLIEKRLKLKRGLAILISYIIVFIFLYIGITVLIPAIVNSLLDLFKNLSDYTASSEQWITNFISDLDMQTASKQIEKFAMEFLSGLTTLLSNMLGSVLTQTIKITSSVVKFIFGFIISIYMLLDKDNLIYHAKRIIILIFPSQKKANYFLSFMSEANNIFGRFIIGKTIDSLIIGVLCYIGLFIINAPYAALIALIVGITNMIPYFGPFIGMVPGFLLTLFVEPSKALWVLLFIFLLQQFDGWYLGPKILGDKVGVSPLFIILAVTLGGGLGGVIGMFISVPIIALIKIYGEKFLEYRAKSKDIDFDEKFKR